VFSAVIDSDKCNIHLNVESFVSSAFCRRFKYFSFLIYFCRCVLNVEKMLVTKVVLVLREPFPLWYQCKS